MIMFPAIIKHKYYTCSKTANNITLFGGTAKPIKTSSDRLCAVNLHVDCISLYLFCVDMPCDCTESENLNEFDNILSEISLLCIKYNAEYVCIAGDLNTDFTRTSSWHTKSMNAFIENENLYAALKHVKTNVDYTYFNDYNSTCSVIDYMFVSHNLSDYINEYYSFNEELENQSDHSPIVLALKLDLIKHVPTTPVKRSRRKWNQTDDQTIFLYKSKLDDYL